MSNTPFSRVARSNELKMSSYFDLKVLDTYGYLWWGVSRLSGGQNLGHLFTYYFGFFEN